MSYAARLPLPARAARFARRRSLLAALVCIATLALAYWFWFRDSSLVAVQRVRIEGLAQGSAERPLRAALGHAARGMTTLDPNPAALERAARPFPWVASVHSSAGFPDALTIRVIERRPVGLIDRGTLAVAGDGTILHGMPTGGLRLPTLAAASAPAGSRLSGIMLQQALILGAMPRSYERFVSTSFVGSSGLSVRFRGGVELRFGDAGDAAEKWRAAGAVLADPGLGQLDYVDLRAADRPAVGGSSHTPPALPAP